MDRAWTLRLSTAEQWFGAAGYDIEDLAGIFPGGLLDRDLDAMWEFALANPRDAQRRWRNTARVALGRAAGRDWWWALNLIKRCLGSWMYINGHMLLRGVDAAALPLATYLDAVYMAMWEPSKEEDRAKLDIELSMPPPDVPYRVSRQALEDFAAL